MESLLEMRIGRVYARSVGGFLIYLKYPLSYAPGATTAEGNPDEEKIGAFGVGEHIYSAATRQWTNDLLGFYSLFSVTENPFVSSGGVVSSCSFTVTF